MNFVNSILNKGFKQIMKIRLQTFSYRFGEQVLNSCLSIKQEIEDVLNHKDINIPDLTYSQMQYPG